jgi:AmmeMemoRadiSam system protein B
MTDHPPTRRVRQPVVAGTFYPADPRALRAAVADLLAHAPHASGVAAPKAIVAPHAGYIYSGPVAATAYRRIEARWSEIERVVIVGPSHRVALDGLAVAASDAFATPLGEVPIDRQSRDAVAVLPHVVIDDAPHADEHSLEVHLPFLQHVLTRSWTLVPIVVGGASAIAVADVLASVWGGADTLVVISTDLSHYHDYPSAAALDRRTADAIVAREVDTIFPADACGAHPLRGLLELSRRAGLEVELLDLRSSGDTAGDRTKVVGYGAFAVT